MHLNQSSDGLEGPFALARIEGCGTLVDVGGAIDVGREMPLGRETGEVCPDFADDDRDCFLPDHQ